MSQAKIERLQIYIDKLNQAIDGAIYWNEEDVISFYQEIDNYLKSALNKYYADFDLDYGSNKRRLASIKSYLLGIIDDLTQEPEKESVDLLVTPNKPNDFAKSNTDTVFLVHGHDDEAKESVARFVSKLGLEPIILHERPNSGKTIIEKLESNAEKISFAIVLLTPDDKGASVESDDEYKYRARQNVIYELGFFNAKLGRDRVCVLKKGDIEVLSDYLGVVYVDMDKNGWWKNQLARELKGAGLQVSSENIEKALLS